MVKMSKIYKYIYILLLFSVISIKGISQNTIISEIREIIENSNNYNLLDDSLSILCKFDKSKKAFVINNPDHLFSLLDSIYKNIRVYNYTEIHNLYTLYSSNFLQNWDSIFYYNLNVCYAAEMSYNILLSFRELNHIKYIDSLNLSPIQIYNHYKLIQESNFNYFINPKIDTTIYNLYSFDITSVNYFLQRSNNWLNNQGRYYYLDPYINLIQDSLFNDIKKYVYNKSNTNITINNERWLFESSINILNNRNSDVDLKFFTETLDFWLRSYQFNKMIKLIGTTKDIGFIDNYIYKFINEILYNNELINKSYAFEYSIELFQKCIDDDRLIIRIFNKIFENDKTSQFKNIEILKYFSGNIYNDYITKKIEENKYENDLQDRLKKILEYRIHHDVLNFSSDKQK
jgi:hypothetical protein